MGVKSHSIKHNSSSIIRGIFGPRTSSALTRKSLQHGAVVVRCLEVASVAFLERPHTGPEYADEHNFILWENSAALERHQTITIGSSRYEQYSHGTEALPFIPIQHTGFPSICYAMTDTAHTQLHALGQQRSAATASNVHSRSIKVRASQPYYRRFAFHTYSARWLAFNLLHHD